MNKTIYLLTSLAIIHPMIDFSITSKPKTGKNNTITTGQHYMTAVDIREKDRKKIFIPNTNDKWWRRFYTYKAFANLKQASTAAQSQNSISQKISL